MGASATMMSTLSRVLLQKVSKEHNEAEPERGASFPG
jgi:hypothetical protein